MKLLRCVTHGRGVGFGCLHCSATDFMDVGVGRVGLWTNSVGHRPLGLHSERERERERERETDRHTIKQACVHTTYRESRSAMLGRAHRARAPCPHAPKKERERERVPKRGGPTPGFRQVRLLQPTRLLASLASTDSQTDGGAHQRGGPPPCPNERKKERERERERECAGQKKKSAERERESGRELEQSFCDACATSAWNVDMVGQGKSPEMPPRTRRDLAIRHILS